MAFLKKLGIWFVSFILSICIFTLIFGSFVNIDLKNMVGDVYTYSDNNAKQSFDAKVNSFCSEVDKFEAQAKAQGMTLDQALELQRKNSQDQQEVENVKNLVKLCEDFKNPSVSKKQGFMNLVDKMVPGGLPDANELFTGKMSPFNGSGDGSAGNGVGTASEIGQIYFIITHIWQILNISLPIFILILLGLLFLFFIGEPKQYIRYLGKMFIRTGIWLIIPFIILQIWLMVHPIDTTPIMNMILQGFTGGSGQPSLDQMQILILLIPLVLKQLYPFAVFLIGILFIALGVVGVLVFKLVSKDSAKSVEGATAGEDTAKYTGSTSSSNSSGTLKAEESSEKPSGKAKPRKKKK